MGVLMAAHQPAHNAEDVRLCGLCLDTCEGCYCELPAGHDGPHVCACGTSTSQDVGDRLVVQPCRLSDGAER